MKFHIHLFSVHQCCFIKSWIIHHQNHEHLIWWSPGPNAGLFRPHKVEWFLAQRPTGPHICSTMLHGTLHGHCHHGKASLNRFFTHYEKTTTPPPQTHPTIPHWEFSPHTLSLQEHQVHSVFRAVDQKKDTGPDGIPGKVLKGCAVYCGQ